MTKNRDTPIKVLVVDDEKKHLDIIKFNLEARATRSSPPATAKERPEWRELRPDSSCAEIMMPDLDGLEVSAASRRTAAPTRSRGHALRQDAGRTRWPDRGGGDDFITSPSFHRAGGAHHQSTSSARARNGTSAPSPAFRGVSPSTPRPSGAYPETSSSPPCT